MTRAWTAAAVLLVVALTWANMDLLADSFWYVAVGRLVLDGHALPTTDPFTYASVPAQVHDAWVVHMPASMVVFAWLERHAGLRSLIVLATVVEAAAACVPWLATTTATKVRARALTLPLVLLAVWIQRDDLCARGQVFADLAWALMLVVILRVERRWLLGAAGVVLGAFWASFHSSFPLAVVVPAALALARPRLWVLAAGAAAGVLLNPYGAALVVDVVRLALHPTTSTVDLFRSPSFHAPDVLLVVAIALAMAPLVARRSRFEALLLAVALLAACWARRNLFLLVSVEVVLAAALVADGAPLRRWLLPSTAGVALVASILLFRTPKDPLGHVPAAAAELVEREHLPDHVLVQYHWGGYADYAWMGRRRALIDGRSWLFFNGVFEDVETIRRLDPGWLELLDMYDVKTVVWEKDDALALVLAQTPGWRCVHTDARAAVFVR